MKNSSVLPINQTFLTQARLTSLDINEDNILKIIRFLSINKAHGHDDTSIRMIKACDKSLLKLLIKKKIEVSYLITEIYGKGLILYLHIKRTINN